MKIILQHHLLFSIEHLWERKRFCWVESPEAYLTQKRRKHWFLCTKSSSFHTITHVMIMWWSCDDATQRSPVKRRTLNEPPVKLCSSSTLFLIYSPSSPTGSCDVLLLGLNAQLLKKVRHVQNTAGWFLTRTRESDLVTAARASLRRVSSRDSIDLKCFSTFCEILHDLTLLYLMKVLMTPYITPHASGSQQARVSQELKAPLMSPAVSSTVSAGISARLFWEKPTIL